MGDDVLSVGAIGVVARGRTSTSLVRRFAAWLVTVASLGSKLDMIASSPSKASSSPFSKVASATSDHLKLAGDEKIWASELPRGVRIAFRMRDYARDEFRFQSDEMCSKNDAGNIRNGKERTSDLPPTLVDVRSEYEWENGFPLDRSRFFGRGGRYLDFATSVATDLRVLFLGDSVAEQFGRAFDLAATVDAHLDPNATNPNRVVHESFLARGGARACVFATAPVRGGGAVGMWRVVKLLSLSRRGLGGRATCNSNAGGWDDGQLRKMLEQEYRAPGAGSPRGAIGKFDAVVLRIQLGWMPPRAITEDRLREAITLCRDHLGADTVVVMTINFTNDVHNPGEWAWAASTNRKLREMARSFNANATEHGSEFRVQIMEFSNFTTQVLWANARTIRSSDGYGFAYPDLLPPNASAPGYEQGADFLFDRFKPWHAKDQHPHSIPSVCSRMTDEFVDERRQHTGIRRNCVYNALMADGLHWCMSSIGPRYHAGLSCLLGCAYNRKYEEGVTSIEGEDVKMERCERSCNEQFMSLLPLNEAWFEKDATMYSVVS